MAYRPGRNPGGACQHHARVRHPRDQRNPRPGQGSPGWRFYIFLDELGQIPPVGGLHAALTAGGKSGLFLVAGVQHVSQLNRYGPNEAKAILSSFGARLVLRQGDAESAEYWSRQIGATEIREWHRSKSDGPAGSGSSESEHVRIRARVLPHQLQELQKLHGYLLVTHHPAAAVRLEPVDRKTVLPAGFVPRDPDVDPPTASEAFESERAAAGPDVAGEAPDPTASTPEAAPDKTVDEEEKPGAIDLDLDEEPEK